MTQAFYWRRYLTESKPLHNLLETLPQVGRVEWIGIRPSRGEPVVLLDAVQLIQGKGVEGDRFSGSADSPRQVTLIQYEHLDVIASCLGRESISPSLLRRNIVVSGINLLALKDKTFQIGDAMLSFSGLCHPCSKMERQLGPGGYNAMRGHGGITARVCKTGLIRLRDRVLYAGVLSAVDS
ncbi:MAG: MOSC domain-containing protein [Candidatus Thiodiazotropha sp. (ex Monitilora ramsayi)]|nr:MOSC domain-containing protein [Candidatus Thiodiazotropha sp. (ex Monitilora ramsayi)]